MRSAAGIRVRALGFGTLVLVYPRYSIVVAAVWSWALWEQVRVYKAACSPPARPVLSLPGVLLALSSALTFGRRMQLP